MARSARLTLLTDQCLAPVPGGTGRYTRELGAALAASAPENWRVHGVTAWHKDVAAARIDGVDGPSRLPVDRRVLARLWAKGLPPALGGTVIHAPTPLAPAGVRPRRAPLVVTVHDVVPWTHPETLTPRGAEWHRTMVERAGRWAQAIVVPTQAVAQGLAEHAGIDRNVHVMGEGVSAAFLQRPAAESIALARQRFGLPERYLVTVGTLEPRKGLDVLLDALALPDGSGLVLAVVGPPGWGDLDLEAEARRRGLTDRVLSLGRLPDSEMTAVVAGAAAAVTASRAEGFGLPLVEAMALGTPVIHSDAPALVEVAGGAGRVVPVGDAAALAGALRSVASDPVLAAELSARGLARAQDHSWTDVARRHWELYNQVRT